MSKTISFVKGKGSINHNNREFTAKNVDASRTSMNVVYVQIPIEEAYEEIFGQPKEIKIIEKLPLTPIGKVDYRALEKLAE